MKSHANGEKESKPEYPRQEQSPAASRSRVLKPISWDAQAGTCRGKPPNLLSRAPRPLYGLLDISTWTCPRPSGSSTPNSACHLSSKSAPLLGPFPHHDSYPSQRSESLPGLLCPPSILPPPDCTSQASQVMLMVKTPQANVGDVREAGSIPGLGRSPGEGNGNPLKYLCLENPIDRGIWLATIHGAAKSRTRLK